MYNVTGSSAIPGEVCISLNDISQFIMSVHLLFWYEILVWSNITILIIYEGLAFNSQSNLQMEKISFGNSNICIDFTKPPIRGLSVDQYQLLIESLLTSSYGMSISGKWAVTCIYSFLLISGVQDLILCPLFYLLYPTLKRSLNLQKLHCIPWSVFLQTRKLQKTTIRVL